MSAGSARSTRPSAAPDGERYLDISLPGQRLRLREGPSALVEVPIGSARLGPGELQNSERTPRGWHVIRAKIGRGAPLHAVFVGRRFTGEVYTPGLGAVHPERDWILTRILWLSGLEPGRNRLGKVDTMRRYIYIHGCPDEVELGQPSSHGCVRMRGGDMVDLFERVDAGTRVFIHE